MRNRCLAGPEGINYFVVYRNINIKTAINNNIFPIIVHC